MTKAQLLFLIILVEGYVVLACELLAIRQLVPFVGSGTETVSIVISAVLMPLAVGYHFGGTAYKRARKKNKHRPPSIRKILLKNILNSLIILSLGLSYVFMEIFFAVLSGIGFEHRLWQATLYSMLFLVAPVFMLGQTVPLVSNYFSRRKLSEITGRMLFFSTTGSFLGSVFSTIVLMSTIGVHNTVIVTLGMLVVLCIILAGKKFDSVIALMVFGVLCVMNSGALMKDLNIVSNNAYNTVTVSELKNDGGTLMTINRSASSLFHKNPEKIFAYAQHIEKSFIAPISAPGSEPRDILILGAGGFVIGYHDDVNHYTYVDIDAALKEVSEKHFLPETLGANKKFVPASARAFVRGDKQTYDVIVLDLFSNVVSIPMESVTQDFLMDVKKRLKPGGALAANIVASPTFTDRFSQRYNNTFASVFPSYTRQIIGDFSAWPDQKSHQVKIGNNILYMYFNHPFAGDTTVYTDDKNTYSLDRN